VIMAGGNAARFDLAGPEGDILAKHRVGVNGVFHIKINAKLPATRNRWAIALYHYDIVAISGEMRKGLFGKRRGILGLFHQVNDPFGPFPRVNAEKSGSSLRYVACRKLCRLKD